MLDTQRKTDTLTRFALAATIHINNPSMDVQAWKDGDTRLPTDRDVLLYNAYGVYVNDKLFVFLLSPSGVSSIPDK